MKRTVFAIESNKGYLREVEEYTIDVLEAAVFFGYEFAVSKLTEIRPSLKEECWLTTVQLPFPHPVGLDFSDFVKLASSANK